MSADRPRLVVFAYACEPDRGSEVEAGWGVVQAMAGFARCVVLVGPEHTAGLKTWQAGHPESDLTFVEVPEPSWAKVANLNRVTRFLVYATWIRTARRRAQALHDLEPFQGAHHVTYSTYWLPSPAAGLGIPYLWGPVGGAVVTPPRLWPLLRWKGFLNEIFDLVAVRLLAQLPSARRTRRYAGARLVQNEATLAKMGHLPARVLNHALFTTMPNVGAREPGDHLVWVSSLEWRKGPALAVRALSTTPEDVRLLMVGTGHAEKAVRRLAARLGVEHRIEFLGRVPRHRVFELISEAAGTVFTGLREEGGIALAEAMLCGTPVIVLANGGAATIAGSATDPARVILVEPGGVADTARRMGEAMTRVTRRPPQGTGPLLDQSAAVQALRDSVREVLS
jgi:glycosyltransferase involved in cell wall biosynthesis